MARMTTEAQVLTMPERLQRYGDGPWLTEPDRVAWAHGPIRCQMFRNMELGVWCGYVAVEPLHPWYMLPRDKIPASVHGGVTFASADQLGAWWLGFDCGHGCDYVPAIAQLWASCAEVMAERQMYRTRAYAADHTQRLAEQARRAMAGKGGAGWQSDLSN